MQDEKPIGDPEDHETGGQEAQEARPVPEFRPGCESTHGVLSKVYLPRNIRHWLSMTPTVRTAPASKPKYTVPRQLLPVSGKLMKKFEVVSKDVSAFAVEVGDT